jgi:hypothetical protein
MGSSCSGLTTSLAKAATAMVMADPTPLLARLKTKGGHPPPILGSGGNGKTVVVDLDEENVVEKAEDDQGGMAKAEPDDLQCEEGQGILHLAIGEGGSKLCT